eukprot:7380403-Prymnesium_polylepis.2
MRLAMRRVVDGGPPRRAPRRAAGRSVSTHAGRSEAPARPRCRARAERCGRGRMGCALRQARRAGRPAGGAPPPVAHARATRTGGAGLSAREQQRSSSAGSSSGAAAQQRRSSGGAAGERNAISTHRARCNRMAVAQTPRSLYPITHEPCR